MDPNSSPWPYAYNRIVPTASSTSSAEDFQHPHLASSAQSLLLQAAHSNIAANIAAGGGSFVSPSPISGYNPVFQQIYHHAAAASAVQPKPAHYASSAVNTPHRQLQIPATLDKQLTSFQNQAAIAAVSSAAAAVVNNAAAATNYYGENSSSSGASPSPTTSTITPTTLSWNTPTMISNTFLAMQQQQQQQQQAQQQQQQSQQQQQHQQQQQLNLAAEKVVSSSM